MIQMFQVMITLWWQLLATCCALASGHLVDHQGNIVGNYHHHHHHHRHHHHCWPPVVLELVGISLPTIGYF